MNLDGYKNPLQTKWIHEKNRTKRKKIGAKRNESDKILSLDEDESIEMKFDAKRKKQRWNCVKTSNDLFIIEINQYSIKEKEL